ncbi:MAG: hypothetical protein IIZ80_01685 [Erysipelotrichaceae bacterium]|nr:hypothetical protein [Erysipelotrichaceae bacterium]
MEVKNKKELERIISSYRLNRTSTTRVLINILIVNVVLVSLAYIAFFHMRIVYARNLKASSFNAYEIKIADELLESYTDTSLYKDPDEVEFISKEDMIVKTVYHSDCNYYMYSGHYSGSSVPGYRTWAHAYDLYRSGKIHGATAGRWCTFFAQMWFYDVFGFNSSGNGAAGNGNTFASTIYATAVYRDEEGNLKHYFRYTDHPETMSIVSIYSSTLPEGHVLCIDEVDYENGTITVSEGNANGVGDIRIRQTMSLSQFYANNRGYKVYVTPTEELLKMISERS